jgi:hypothetical protein
MFFTGEVMAISGHTPAADELIAERQVDASAGHDTSRIGNDSFGTEPVVEGELG